jgi:competence protein CoiA
MQAKLDIFAALQKHQDITKLQLERPLGDVRPDISFYLRNIPVALEVQVSTLSLDTIDQRTRAYTRKGISLLWTSPYPPTMDDTDRYSPALWEKYLHALYFGKLYYWVSDETLQPVRFDEYLLHVEYREWYVPSGEGEMDYAGGYDCYSKRYRTPYLLDRVNITSLALVNRKAWSSKTLSTPAARLWCEPYVSRRKGG